jgi:eukaryotic-like serine/threonine-protein kinase
MNASPSGPGWSQIKAMFNACMEQPFAKREDWLTNACAGDAALEAEICTLLDAQSARSGVLANDSFDLLAGLLADDDEGDAPDDDWIGRSLGPYRLLRVLGHGGMGSVYLAERTDGQFTHQVALKRIRSEVSGAEIEKRFLRERQILASLHHPHIAQLHDGGVADDGSPFFTLEYVDGEPIARYSDRKRLSVAARLRLMLTVCNAVQYAHRNLVVHRDLKPSNILVTAEGEAKLLDFGIAKLLVADAAPELTGTQTRVMTREYAAPEQVLGEPITTATDVYALGVLLYELLCGHLPYAKAESGAIGWSKAIIEETPQALSRALSRNSAAGLGTNNTGIQPASGGNQPRTFDDARIAADRDSTLPKLKRVLRGDLERIVQRALEKNPEARYASVTALADDLRAYLDGRALPGGNRRYRIEKFLRRHRVPVAIAASLGAIVMVSVIVIAISVQAALREARTTAAVKDFLLSLFSASDPRQTQGKDPTVRDVLDRGAKRIEKDLDDQPEAKAELQSALGGIYLRLGAYPQAEALQEQAAKALETHNGKPLLTALTLREWGESLRDQGKLDAAKSILDRSIDRYQKMPDPPVKDLDYTIYIRAFISITGKEFDEALRFTEVEEKLARQHPELPELIGNTLNARGAAHWGLHDYAKAEAELHESLKALRAAYGEDSVQQCAPLQALSIIYRDSGRRAESFVAMDQALAVARRNMPERHPYVADLLASTGQAQYRLGHFSDAQIRLEQALAVQRELLGTDHEAVGDSLQRLGIVLGELGQLEQGERDLNEALKIFNAIYKPDDATVLNARADLAYLYLLQTRLDLAERELREILPAMQTAGNSAISTVGAYLGEVRRKRGDLSEALTLERAALDSAIRTRGEQSEEAATVRYYLGMALAASKDDDGAQSALRKALDYYVRLLPEDTHPQAATIRLELGRLLALHENTRIEAIDLLQRAIAARRSAFGAEHEFTLAAQRVLAEVRTLERSAAEKRLDH